MSEASLNKQKHYYKERAQKARERADRAEDERDRLFVKCVELQKQMDELREELRDTRLLKTEWGCKSLAAERDRAEALLAAMVAVIDAQVVARGGYEDPSAGIFIVCCAEGLLYAAGKGGGEQE